MAQSVKSLLHKNEALSLDHQHPCEKLGMAVCIYNSSPEESNTEGFLELAGQQTQWEMLSQKWVGEQLRKIVYVDLWLEYTHLNTQMHIHNKLKKVVKKK